MIRILILACFVIFGYGLGWVGRFRLILKSGSRTERVLETIHLAGVALLSLIMIVLPPLTGFDGRPELAYVACAILFVSLALFSIRVQSITLSLSPATGSKAKPVAEQRQSKWPHSVTWFAGYCLAAWYVGTVYAKFGW
ncbi:hypothetical protein ACIQC5_21210 [Paenarthrobacter sp. NPDC092416]|uniref:hypothetical protein n=1 Tax=Paenarthrobacter sp. NPDC092416 TaxID=3364386 RepID=UPI00382114E4